MNDLGLIKKAFELSKAAPDEWQQFLEALEENYQTQRDALVSSHSDTLQLLQGRAQFARDLLKLLRECRTTADRIEATRRTPTNGSFV